jgi:hypothetical protein
MLAVLGSPYFAEQRQKAHESAVRLAEADPTDREAQRDLWVSYNKLGEARESLGNRPKRKSTSRRAWLSAADWPRGRR